MNLIDSTIVVVFCFLFSISNAQYLVEVLEHTSFDTQRVVTRCEATGATFGQSVVDFSFSDKAVGCAVFAEPRKACGPVKLRPLKNESECDSYFAVVERGNCSFSEKAYHVQNAHPFGFDAMIVYNTDKKSPIPMSDGKYADDVNVPVVMVYYACMRSIMGQYSAAAGYRVMFKASPGYYDLIKYLVPFVVIVGFCFIILFVSLIIRLCRERRRLARKRLSRSNLRKIPVKKYKLGEEAETCAICLEDFRANDKVRELPCRHIYHQKCIDPWLTKNRKVCPICKRKVGPSNGSDSSDSDSERNTVSTTLPANSRDVDPLIRNAQPMPTSEVHVPQPNHQFRWFQRRSEAHRSVDQPTTSGVAQNSVYLTPNLTQNDDEHRSESLFSRLRNGMTVALQHLRQHFTPTPSNVHSRLDNDDSLSNMGLDTEVAHRLQAPHPNVVGNENNAYDRSSANSMSTVCVEVESAPADPNHQV
ncbi:RING-type domain-containing protein [Aphelenchoides besseyi]|nr:RING-type domain-containing protein [Aphelenchoides besseyi]KAI6209374.1 RING-type domain-containing protein [Aphelenchoides besseyi]